MSSYLGHEFSNGRCVLCGAVEKSVREFRASCDKANALPKPPPAQTEAPAATREREIEPTESGVSPALGQRATSVVISDITIPFASVFVLTLKVALSSALVSAVGWIIYAAFGGR